MPPGVISVTRVLPVGDSMVRARQLLPSASTVSPMSGRVFEMPEGTPSER